MIRALLIIVVTLASTSTLHPWPRLPDDPKKMVVSFGYFQSPEFYTGEGKLKYAPENGRYIRLSTNIYVDIPIGKKLTGFVNMLTLGQLVTGKWPYYNSRGFGNPYIGVNHNFTGGNYDMNACLKVDLPLHFLRGESPELGNKFAEYELLYSMGRQYEKSSWAGGISYMYRDNRINESRFRGGFAGSIRLSKKWSLLLNTDYIFASNTAYKKLAIMPSIQLNTEDMFSLSADLEIIPYAKLTGTGFGGYITMWMKYRK